MKTFYRILILPFRLSLFGFIVQSIPLEKFDIIIIVVVVGLLHSSRIKNLFPKTCIWPDSNCVPLGHATIVPP